MKDNSGILLAAAAVELGMCIPVPLQLALGFGHCKMEIFFSYEQLGLDPSSPLALPICWR